MSDTRGIFGGSPSGAFVQPGTTGDIVWSRLDPRTWYLYNQQPSSASAAILPSSVPTSTTTSTTTPPQEQKAYGDVGNWGVRQLGTARVLTPAEEVAKRKEARTGYHALDKLLRQNERANPETMGGRYSADTVTLLEQLLQQGHIGMGDDWQDTMYNYPGGKNGQRRLDQLIDWYRDRKLYGP